MVCWRCFIASGFITLLTLGCDDWANSAGKNTRQIVQETNVAQLFSEAETTQKAEKFFQQGNFFLNSQRYKDAIAAFEQAITIKPQFAEAWINRGNALTKLQHYQEALASYDRAIAIQPDRDEAWYNKGNTLNTLERYQEALVSYDRASQSKQINMKLGLIEVSP